jgi:hypothetical protein
VKKEDEVVDEGGGGVEDREEEAESPQHIPRGKGCEVCFMTYVG